MNVTHAILALGLVVMVDASLTAKPRHLPNQIITSVMNDLSHSAQYFIPDCSDTTCPRTINAFFLPDRMVS